jgi:hypothetical protein
MPKPAYRPGVCNINSAEIAYRKRWGYIGAYLFIVLGGLMLLGEASWWMRLVLYAPAYVSAIGFLQARNHFCIYYAAASQQQAAESAKRPKKVTAAQHAQDMKKAHRMKRQAGLIAAAATALLAFI